MYVCTFPNTMVIMLIHLCSNVNRGESFRLSYARIGEIRCLLLTNVHVMALTATVTKDTFSGITSSLGMVNPVCVMEQNFKAQGYSCSGQ